MRRAILPVLCLQCGLWAQEAQSGFELRATLSAGAFHTGQLEAKPRFGQPVTAGFRSVLYPTWKLNRNWAVSGAIQTHSRPYFFEEFSTQGYGVRTDILQAHLSYSRFWKSSSVVVRMGQLSSAFGSFLLRYGDNENPLIDVPMAYGYYYKSVSSNGLTGVQADATAGKLDARAQFVNSSPANRRSIVDSDQYGNWSGGMGYTLRQGFRVGVSAYRGPYLHRQYRFYYPGEIRPRDLPGSGYGLDGRWGRGPWNVYGEWQKFHRAYRAIADFHSHTGYLETRRVLHPRWYIATRLGYIRASSYAGKEAYEVAAGYRPGAQQLVKVGYQMQRGANIRGASGNTFAVQFVTSFQAISIARD